MVAWKEHPWGWHLYSWFGPGILFLAVMTVFFLLYEPFREAGPSLTGPGDFEWEGGPAAPGDFPAPKDSWVRTNPRAVWKPGAGRSGSGGIEIEGGEAKGGSVRLVVTPPGGTEFLRVTGWLKTEGVTQGRRTWYHARIVFFFQDREGKGHFEIPHVACHRTGTNDWLFCDKVFAVPDFAADGQLLLQNQGRTGTAWFDDLQVRPVVRKQGAVVWQVAFTSGWTLLFLLALGELKPWRRPLGWLIVALLFAILAGVTLSIASLQEVTDQGLAIWDERAAPATSDAPPPPPRSNPSPLTSPEGFDRMALDFTLHKGAHALLFGALGGVVCLSLRRSRLNQPPAFRRAVVRSLPPLLLFAVATEILQFPTASRSPRLSDILINSAGVLAGIAIGWLSGLRTGGSAGISGKVATPGGPSGRG